MNTCKYCGEPAPEGSDVCPGCSALLKIADAVKKNAAEPAVSEKRGVAAKTDDAGIPPARPDESIYISADDSADSAENGSEETFDFAPEQELQALKAHISEPESVPADAAPAEADSSEKDTEPTEIVLQPPTAEEDAPAETAAPSPTAPLSAAPAGDKAEKSERLETVGEIGKTGNDPSPAATGSSSLLKGIKTAAATLSVKIKKAASAVTAALQHTGKAILRAARATGKCATAIALFFAGKPHTEKELDECDVKQNTLLACFGYVPLMFPIPVILRPRSKFLKYHAVCGGVCTAAMLAVELVSSVLCRIWRAVFTVKIYSGTSFEHTALSGFGYGVMELTELLALLTVIVIFLSGIAMPIFGRRHTLAPERLYSIAEKLFTSKKAVQTAPEIPGTPTISAESELTAPQTAETPETVSFNASEPPSEQPAASTPETTVPEEAAAAERPAESAVRIS